MKTIALAVFSLCIVFTQAIFFIPPNMQCCPETMFGILCDNTTLAKTKPLCFLGQTCCLRLDNAYDCCDDRTQYCDYSTRQCEPLENAPQHLTPVRLGIFSESLAFAVARVRNLWVLEGLNVTYTVVKGSTNQFQLIQSNSIDIASTAVDNNINYDLNTNNGVGAIVTTVVFAATDLGENNAIISLPNITSLSQLKGTIIGVDSPSSGFAYIVYDILASGGVLPGEYTVVALGGGNQRQAGLEAGVISAALLSAENLIELQAQGFNLLRTYAQIHNITLNGGLSATPAYIRSNPQVVLAFLRAYYVAVQYLVNPANKQAVIELIASSNVSVNPPLFYDYNVNPLYGTKADCIVTKQGLVDLINDRNKYGGFQNGTLSSKQICNLIQDPGPIYNMNYLQLAVNSLGYAYKDQEPTCQQIGLGNLEDITASAGNLAVSMLTLLFAAVSLILLA